MSEKRPVIEILNLWVRINVIVVTTLLILCALIWLFNQSPYIVESLAVTFAVAVAIWLEQHKKPS